VFFWLLVWSRGSTYSSFILAYLISRRRGWAAAQLLRHYDTSLKVASSRPNFQPHQELGFHYSLFICGAGVERRPLLLLLLIGLLYQPWMIDDDISAISGMNEWQRKPKYSEKTCPVPLCPLQIPYNSTRARNRTANGGSQRLTIWATAQPRNWGLLRF
jgi:hypothetical protein